MWKALNSCCLGKSLQDAELEHVPILSHAVVEGRGKRMDVLRTAKNISSKTLIYRIGDVGNRKGIVVVFEQFQEGFC